jgi:hypothetical protein
LPPKPNWVWVSESGKIQHPVSLFEPSSDPVYCALVLDEIERRGWLWTWKRIIGGGAGFEIITRSGKTFFATNLNRYRAVCEAALQAAEAER